MTNKKENNKKEKLPFKRRMQNHIFLLKIIMKACPARLFFDLSFNALFGLTEFLSYSLLLRYAINGISEGRSFGSIAALTAGFFGVQILLLVMNNLYNDVWAPRLGENANRYVQRMLFNKAREVDLSCYENPEFYDKYIKALNEGAGRVSELINSISSTAYVAVTLIANAALILTIDPWLVLFAVIPFAASFLKIRRDKLEYEKNMIEAEQGRRRKYVRRVFYLNEFAKDVRLTTIERPMMKYYNDSSETVLRGIKKYGLRMWGLSYVMSVARRVISYLGSIIYCVVRTTAGEMLYGDAVVAIGVVGNISEMLSQAVSDVTDFRKIALYTENLRKFLDYEPKIAPNADGLDPQGGDIVFENVSFTYDGCDKPALENVSIRVGRGERVALVGHNGAGKSTLIKLMMRLYEPTSGRIMLDGRDVSEYKLAEYRAGFGTVFQDVRLFAMTVAENVLGRRAESDDDREAVVSALKKSGAYDRVMKMKHGVDNMLTREFDDDGEVLSGGEAQKLAIARVFARDNFCIILDEPTSALDPIAEAEMYKHMNEAADGDRSMIFISHRLSSAVDADRIYLLDNGRVIEEGTHGELMAKNGAYAAMFLRQAENYRTSGDSEKEAGNDA